jgi:hypothetical protein
MSQCCHFKHKLRLVVFKNLIITCLYIQPVLLHILCACRYCSKILTFLVCVPWCDMISLDISAGRVACYLQGWDVRLSVIHREDAMANMSCICNLYFYRFKALLIICKLICLNKMLHESYQLLAVLLTKRYSKTTKTHKQNLFNVKNKVTQKTKQILF